MYLRAQRYISAFRFQREKENPEVNQYDRLVELFGMGEYVTDDSPSAYVDFTIGYWRKANHIHDWFVQNVQGGVDECQEAHVSREKLVELRETCLRVLASSDLVDGDVYAGTIYSSETPAGAVQFEAGQIVADPSIANDLLPRSEGFFFGGQDYDQWYWEDTKRTVEIIDKALTLLDGDGYWSIIYQSSW